MDVKNMDVTYSSHILKKGEAEWQVKVENRGGKFWVIVGDTEKDFNKQNLALRYAYGKEGDKRVEGYETDDSDLEFDKYDSKDSKGRVPGLYILGTTASKGTQKAMREQYEDLINKEKIQFKKNQFKEKPLQHCPFKFGVSLKLARRINDYNFRNREFNERLDSD